MEWAMASELAVYRCLGSLPSQEDESGGTLDVRWLYGSLGGRLGSGRIAWREEYSWLDEVPWKSKFIRFTN